MVRNTFLYLPAPGPQSLWRPRVLTCSAREQRNIDEIWEMIEEFARVAGGDEGLIARRRAAQNSAWLERLTRELIEQRLQRDPQLATLLDALRREVAAGTVSPLSAARRIIGHL